MLTQKSSALNTCIRILVLSMPLLLNDFYLPLVPEEAVLLNFIIDVIIYVFWQGTVIYLAYQAGWFDFSDLGIKPDRFICDILYGIILAAGLFAAYLLLVLFTGYLKKHAGISITGEWHYPMPESSPHLRFAYVTYLALTAGLFEEVIYRGIVIAQLRRLTANRALLVLASAFVFTAIHWSNGPLTWIEAFVLGAFWAGLFIRTGRIIPIMTAHFIFDFVTIYGLHGIILGVG